MAMSTQSLNRRVAKGRKKRRAGKEWEDKGINWQQGKIKEYRRKWKWAH